MRRNRRQTENTSTSGTVSGRSSIRPVLLGLLFVLSLAQIPVASAHGGTAIGGLAQGHGVFLALLGVTVLIGATILKRRGRVPSTVALYGVFAGITITALGAVLFEGLSPDPTYTANSMPFPRSWYEPLGLLTGFSIMVASFIVGWLRWPSRPRYTFLGILMGLWISYPYLIPGQASDTHPLGYTIVLGTPVFIGYVIWKDAGRFCERFYETRLRAGSASGSVSCWRCSSYPQPVTSRSSPKKEARTR